MVDAAIDLQFMERALFLAERGRGRTTPNPIVGAVVVSEDGIVVGQGAHLQAGEAHAEVIALDAAGRRANGATLYCTLEPCAHQGRTGPCVERIVASGIRRVVSATRDPNPLVAGKGIAFLRDHHVAVTEQVGEPTALRQHAPFFTWMRHRRPFITLKTATTADGFVGRLGERVAITSRDADRYFHRQRAETDAIAVGSTTVLVDDPLLTARGAYRHRPLTRVVFDWRARISASARLFSTLQAGPVIMVVLAEALDRAPGYLAEWAGHGVVFEACATKDLPYVARRLAARDVQSLLVEGGPRLHEAFLADELVDRVQWVQSPDEWGTGVPMSERLSAWLRTATPSRQIGLGRDLLREFDVYRAG